MTTGDIVYLEGDVLALHQSPHRAMQLGDGAELDVVAHIVNNVGAWGAGFTAALDQKFGPWARRSYAMAYTRLQVARYDTAPPDQWLGQVECVRVGRSVDGVLFPTQGPSPIYDVPGVEESSTYLAHLFAQNGLRSATNRQPFNLQALEKCVDHMCASLELARNPASTRIHMPRIGTGLGGGKWRDIEPQIRRLARLAPTYVYDYRA